MTASAEARDTALLAAQAAADKLATDVSIVDVSDRLAITDAFVLASAPNERQVQSIVDAVEERLREHGIKPVRREGVAESRWVLLDFVDVVVHVQHAEERAYYALERLWKDCPTIPFVDSAAAPARHAEPRPRTASAGEDDDRPVTCRALPGAAGAAAGAVAARPDRVERHRPLPGPARPAAGRGGPRARPASRRRTSSPPGCRREDTVVVSSDLSRAAETAAALTDLLGVPLRLDAAAARARHGLLGGADPRRGGRAVPRPVRRLDGRAARARAAAVRSPADVAERALAALVDLPPAPVAVVVTHGGTAGRLMERLLGLGPDHRRVFGPLGNCAWSELVAPGRPLAAACGTTARRCSSRPDGAVAPVPAGGRPRAGATPRGRATPARRRRGALTRAGGPDRAAVPCARAGATAAAG